MRSKAPAAALSLVLLASGCARGRQYELRGQILAVDPARQEVTIKHGDITGFMPGMTMPFKVQDARLLDGRTPGDLVRATLVVEDTRAYVTAIDVVGHGPVTDSPPRRLDLMHVGDAVPDVALVDQDGTPRRLSDWRGHVLGVTFTYTRCPLPDFCPLMDRNFAAIQAQAAADADLRRAIHLVSVSFDPDFDTPPVLLAHARRARADPAIWSFLTGTRADLDRMTSRFGVSVIRDDQSGIVHNLRTAIVDGDGRLAKVFNGNDWEPAEVIAEMRSLVAER